MEREIQEGDLIIISINNKITSVAISRITPTAIYAGTYTIIPIEGVWKISNFPFPHSISFRAQDYLRIISLNVGHNVMTNIVAGSEKSLVKICQTKYNGGWKDSSQKISTCSYNSAKLLSQYTLFGIQEVPTKYKDKFQETIQSLNPTADYHFIYGTNILTGFDQNVTGMGISLTPANYLLIDRGMQIIWFPKLNLIFINLHAPHNINIKSEIEKNCAKITIPRPERIIMVGDFNDFKGTLLKQSIDIFGHHLTIPRMMSIQTCCADSQYQYPGDYIFTSNYKWKYYGYPPNYTRGHPVISDHDPVVLY